MYMWCCLIAITCYILRTYTRTRTHTQEGWTGVEDVIPLLLQQSTGGLHPPLHHTNTGGVQIADHNKHQITQQATDNTTSNR